MMHTCILKSAIFMVVIFLLTGMCEAQVPVRLSVKFILDENMQFPATGACNTEADMEDQAVLGNGILSDMRSELRLENIEIIGIWGVDSHGLCTCRWYDSPITAENFWAFYAEVLVNPQYAWRNDAINIYVNGSADAGMGGKPPSNRLIMLGQLCRDSTVIHETGHTMNLDHTHEEDSCADTILDNDTWSADDISQNNFQKNYSALTASEKEQVDMVLYNVLSYHTTRDRLSHCQMDRISKQGYDDRGWVYSRQPIYVNSAHTGLFEFGSFNDPYKTLPNALNAGNLDYKVLVLQQGSYTSDQSLVNSRSDMLMRFGPSHVRLASPDTPLYSLPVNLEESLSPQVKEAINAVRVEDSKARKAREDGRKVAEKSKTEKEKQAAMLTAEEKSKTHRENGLAHLFRAEKFAESNEKIAIQLELAQRLRQAGDCKRAVQFYTLVAEATDQENLKNMVLRYAEECGKQKKKGRP